MALPQVYADEEVEDSFPLQGIISSSKHLRPWKHSLSTLLLLQWLSIDINAPYNTVILTSTLYHHRHPCQHLLPSTSSPGISMARRKDSPKGTHPSWHERRRDGEKGPLYLSPPHQSSRVAREDTWRQTHYSLWKLNSFSCPDDGGGAPGDDTDNVIIILQIWLCVRVPAFIIGGVDLNLLSPIVVLPIERMDSWRDEEEEGADSWITRTLVCRSFTRSPLLLFISLTI